MVAFFFQDRINVLQGTAQQIGCKTTEISVDYSLEEEEKGKKKKKKQKKGAK